MFTVAIVFLGAGAFGSPYLFVEGCSLSYSPHL